jgi:lysophospholipase L1-like esterase
MNLAKTNSSWFIDLSSLRLKVKVMRWPGSLFFKRIALLLISVSFSLLVLEIFLRVVSPPSPWSPLLPLRPKNRMELHVNLNGVSPVAIHSTNSLGLRGDEPPANWNQSYTIVTIGGSTTQCFFLDDHKTWPYLLGQNLKDKYENVWVGNGGLDGQTTRAHIIFMEEVISRLRPKAVVLLVGANDLGLSLREDRRLRGNGFDAGKPIWHIRFFGRSRLFQILYLWKQALFDDVKVVNKSGDGDRIFKPLPQVAEQLPADLRTLLPTLNEYRQNIERIIQLGRSYNVRVVFLTQPLLYEDTEYWKRIEGNFYWINQTKGRISAASYWKLLDIYNKTLLETCAKERVECFDLASAIPHNDSYFYDNGHFNERGAALVAEQVAAFLKQSLARDRVPLVASH